MYTWISIYSVTLYLLQTYPSGKPLFKDQGPVNITNSLVNWEKFGSVAQDYNWEKFQTLFIKR